MSVTVVGSMPIQPSRERMACSYISHADPFAESLESSVKAQLDCGVEIVSDGQTRDTMVNIFARHLRGVRMKERPVVISDVEWKGPITLGDMRAAREVVSSARGGGATPEEHGAPLLKGCVTGPFTMAMGVLDNHYSDLAERSMAFARAMNREARAIEEAVDSIQFDEPFLSLEYPEFAGEMISKARDGLTKPVAMHVCGDVARIFPSLAGLPVDILDHEFCKHPELLKVIGETKPRQTIGFGCARSDDPRVESAEEMAASIRKAVGVVGMEGLLLDPDCGLRNLPIESALGKLRNIVKARDLVIADA